MAAGAYRGAKVAPALRIRFGPTSVQLKGWLHRLGRCMRHQMRHLCDLHCFFAKQVLSQLSYTPTLVSILLIVRHLAPLENCENLEFILGSLAACLIRKIGVARYATTKLSSRGQVVDPEQAMTSGSTSATNS